MNDKKLTQRIQELETELKDLKTKQKNCSLCYLNTNPDVLRSIEYFDQITPHSLDVYWTTNMQLQFQYVSPSIYSLTGWTQEEYLKRNITEIFPPKSLQTIQKVIGEAMQELAVNPQQAIHKVRTIEIIQIKKDGTSYWSEANCSFIIDSFGRPSGFQGYTRDITHRKKQEEEFSELMKFKEILSGLSIKFINLPIENLSTGIQETLSKIQKLSLINEVLFIYKNPFENCWIANSSSKKFQQQKKWLKWFSTEILEPQNKKNVLYNFLESPCGKSCIVLPVFNENELIGGIIGVDTKEKIKYNQIIDELLLICNQIFSNILSRIYSEYKISIYQNRLEFLIEERTQDLAESEKKYRALIDATGTGYCIFDIEFNILELNNDFAFMMGKNSVSEVTGKNINQFILEKNLKIEMENCCNKENSSFYFFTTRVTVNFQEEKNVILELTIRRVDIKGETRYLCLSRDITIQQKTQEKLVNAQRMDSIGSLAGGVAHDFNNILAGISGFIQLIHIAKTKEKRDTFIEKSLESIERAKEITQSLLAYSRQKTEIIESVNITKLCEEASGMISQLSGKTISLNTSLNKKIYSVDGNPSQLLQVIMNLLVNAFEACEEYGEIFLKTSIKKSLGSNIFYDFNEDKDKEFVVIEVEDKGCGISPSKIKQIFDPFFTTKIEGEKKGTGLGLSTVYAIIQKHKGALSVNSKSGKGTVFKVFLPKGKLSPNDKINTENINFNLQGKKILVVDDEELTREFMSNYLHFMDCKTITQNNGKQAVDYFMTHPDEISIIIMDVAMPVMNGVEAAKLILEKYPETPVLFITGYTHGIEKLDEILELENCGILMKPYNFKDLTESLSKLKI